MITDFSKLQEKVREVIFDRTYRGKECLHIEEVPELKHTMLWFSHLTGFEMVCVTEQRVYSETTSCNEIIKLLKLSPTLREHVKNAVDKGELTL